MSKYAKDASSTKVSHPSVLMALADLGEKYKTSVLCIRHLNKATQSKALYRGMGSVDFSAATRSIILAGQDPDNPQKRALFHLKSSLAEAGPSLGYSLSGDGFSWTGLSDMTIGAIMKSELQEHGAKSALTEAEEFLAEVLQDGTMPYREIEAEAKQCNISKSTLDRAKANLGIKSVKEGDIWVWQISSNNAGNVGTVKENALNKGLQGTLPRLPSESAGDVEEDSLTEIQI